MENEILDTLKQVRFEMEQTAGWEIMTSELKGKVIAGIIKLEAGMPLPHVRPEALATLDKLIGIWFNKELGSIYEQEPIDLAKDLNRTELLDEMEKEQKQFENAI